MSISWVLLSEQKQWIIITAWSSKKLCKTVSLFSLSRAALDIPTTLLLFNNSLCHYYLESFSCGIFITLCQIWPVKNIILCLINFSMSYENVDTVFCSLIFFVPLINFHCFHLLISSQLIHIIAPKIFHLVSFKMQNYLSFLFDLSICRVHVLG